MARLAADAVAAFANGDASRDPVGTVDRLAKLVDAGAAEAAARRTRIIALLAALGRALRDALVLRAGVAPGAVARLSGAEGADVARLAADHGEGLERAIVHLARLEEEVDQSVNPTLVLEGLVLDVGGALRPRGARTPAGAITPVASGGLRG